MTVSQVFINNEVLDASVNLQVAEELKKKELAKKDGNVKNIKDVSYDTKDSMFMTLVSAVALTTTSFFSYSPTSEVVRSSYIKDMKLKESDVSKDTKEQDETLKSKLKQHEQKLI